MAVHENRTRAKLGCGSQGHGGMHAKFARLVRCSRNYSALVALASDYYCLPFQRRIVKLFHRDEEGVHVNVEDGFGGGRHGGTQIVDEKQSSEPPEAAWNFGARGGRLGPCRGESQPRIAGSALQ